jgi:hypothetical protein
LEQKETAMKKPNFTALQTLGIMLVPGDVYRDDNDLNSVVGGLGGNSANHLNKPGEGDNALYIEEFAYRLSADTQSVEAITNPELCIMIRNNNGMIDLKKHGKVDWSQSFEWKPYINSIVNLTDCEFSEAFFAGLQVDGYAVVGTLEDDNIMKKFEGETVQVLALSKDGSSEYVSFKHPIKGVGCLRAIALTGENASERYERQRRERSAWWLHAFKTVDHADIANFLARELGSVPADIPSER